MSFSRPVMRHVAALVLHDRGRRCGRSPRRRTRRRRATSRGSPASAAAPWPGSRPPRPGRRRCRRCSRTCSTTPGIGLPSVSASSSSVVGLGRHREDRRLGQPVARQHRRAERVAHVVDELRRLRRTAAREVRGCAGTRARRGSSGTRGRPCGTACPTRPPSRCSRDSTSGVRSGWKASIRIRQQPVCSDENSQVIPPMWVNGKMSAERSVPTRPRHWLMPRADRRDRRVGVAGALRIGSGARRVEEPPHRLVVGVEGGGLGRQDRQVALGQRPVRDQHPHAVGLLGELGGHRLEVEAVPGARHDQQRERAPAW